MSDRWVRLLDTLLNKSDKIALLTETLFTYELLLIDSFIPNWCFKKWPEAALTFWTLEDLKKVLSVSRRTPGRIVAQDTVENWDKHAEVQWLCITLEVREQEQRLGYLVKPEKGRCKQAFVIKYISNSSIYSKEFRSLHKPQCSKQIPREEGGWWPV